MADSDGRAIKRIKQACSQCRRKKSRCPGEKPVCSLCERLNQPCTYSDETVQQHVEPQEDRFDRLEQKVDFIMERLSRNNRSSSSPTLARVPPFPKETSTASNVQLPPRVVLRTIAELYVYHCDCQPLALFAVENLQQNIERYSHETIFAILAITVRFSHDPFFESNQQELSLQYAEISRRQAMSKITEGQVDLAALQALCLLAFLDLTAGNRTRALLHVGIGTRLIQAARMDQDINKTPTETEERRRCFWAFHMVECLCSDGRAPFLPSMGSPPYPRSASRPVDTFLAPLTTASPPKESAPDLGVVGYAIQLTTLWKDVVSYSQGRANGNDAAPWLHDSGYSKLNARLMEYEAGFSNVNRFTSARFPEQKAELLRQHTGYWSTWFYLQFVYHTIASLLNHPFALSEITNTAKARSSFVPLAFLGNCTDQALLHSNWIDVFIGLINDKEYPVSDPFLAYCATIAASIQLWYCYVEDQTVKEQARSRFSRCYQFTGKLGKLWPIAQVMTDNLRLINMKASTWNPSTTAPFTPAEIPRTDKDMYWIILEYVSSEHEKNTNSLILHSTLDPSATRHVPDVHSRTPYSQEPVGSYPLGGCLDQGPLFPDDLGMDLFDIAFQRQPPIYGFGLHDWSSTGDL